MQSSRGDHQSSHSKNSLVRPAFVRNYHPIARAPRQTSAGRCKCFFEPLFGVNPGRVSLIHNPDGDQDPDGALVVGAESVRGLVRDLAEHLLGLCSVAALEHVGGELQNDLHEVEALNLAFVPIKGVPGVVQRLQRVVAGRLGHVEQVQLVIECYQLSVGFQFLETVALLSLALRNDGGQYILGGQVLCRHACTEVPQLVVYLRWCQSCKAPLRRPGSAGNEDVVHPVLHCLALAPTPETGV
ncbi:hypothetical protein PG993_005563 [Apiospora rasikravindrae]|uniref:Uncharacterized protein n=1 Tax=Apiospora rasikravindrae TaxID=990691 RepID=A0ABR1TFZ1_9PEZI